MLGLSGEVFGDRETYVAGQLDDAYLQHLLASAGFVAVVAFSGTAVIGGLAGHVLPRFEQARSELHIYDLVVTAAHGRQGVATRQ